ncbi:MAG TPA: hypothetical protein VLR46_05150 [Candidatus Dormibacteraeota bacterium]|nr:hypothetical protein [Candidatus Dormibacteraeota bacterium]
MTSDAEGVVVLEEKVLVIKSIHVRYHLAGCPDDKREAADRSHAFHAGRCPVAKSIGGCIAITTELEFV